MSNLFLKAARVARTEGFTSLLKKGARFLRQRIYAYDVVYLIEHPLTMRKEEDFLPRIQDYESRFISSPEEALELSRAGYDIYSLPFFDTLNSLRQGAVAFCVLVSKEVAHVGWVALSEKAKNTFDSYPYNVDFNAGEACTGGTVTLPKYEGRGLMTYGYYKRFEYLREKGILTVRAAVSVKNKASQKVHNKFDARIYGKSRQLRILRFRTCRETRNPTLLPMV